MANTMKALQTYTVGAGGVASFTFSNIPQTYTDLIVKASTRSAGGGIGTTRVAYNSDLTSSYAMRYFQGNGGGVSASATSGEPTNNNQVFINDGNSSTANTFGNGELYVPNYVASTARVQASDALEEEAASTAFMRMSAGYWSKTDAITSITFYNDAGNFAQYSTFTLYGVFNKDTSVLPSVPTIGASAQNAAGSSAAVAFTGVSGAASYTATSTPGSFTGSNNMSPVVVSGLTDGTAYTFTVKANNPLGSSAASSSSGSVTSTTFAAYWAGGISTTERSTIQQFKFFAETRSNISATLSATATYVQGLANSGVNGYFAGGQTGSTALDTVQKLNFGTLTISTSTALPAARNQSMNGYSNSGTAGYIPGGGVGGGGSATSIAKIAYSNDATSTISATLPTANSRGSGCANSPTAGYTMGGSGSTVFNTIIKMTFSGETTSTLSATFPFGIYTSTSGSNNGTAAYVFGGYNSGTMYTTIKKLAYSGETVSTLSSNMSSQDFGADAQVGSWSGNAGYVGMGYNWVGSSGNQIGKLPYSTETWSVVSATMANAHLLDAGSCSNSGIL